MLPDLLFSVDFNGSDHVIGSFLPGFEVLRYGGVVLEFGDVEEDREVEKIDWDCTFVGDSVS